MGGVNIERTRPFSEYRPAVPHEQTCRTRRRDTAADHRRDDPSAHERRPAKTTISAIAEEAGVTRLTVYRHFPDEEQLYRACTSHWLRRHPPPDPDTWRHIADLQERALHGLDQLYGWYEENADALHLFDGDAETIPAAVRQAYRAADAAAGDAICDGFPDGGDRGRMLRAAAGHVVAFSTWRSLAVEQALTHRQTVQLATRFLLALNAED